LWWRVSAHVYIPFMRERYAIRAQQR
jgi:hypothetical protein